MLLALGMQVDSALADEVLAGEGPLTGSSKHADRSSVPPGGTVQYSIVLSNSTGTLISSATVVDVLDPRLSYLGNVTVDPSGSALWDDDTPGYITFTVVNISPTVTLSFDAALTTAVQTGEVISNVAIISDGVNLVRTNEVTFAVSQPPDLQIHTPEMGQLITQDPDTAFAVVGYAWGDFDPPPFPDVPHLQPIDNFDGGGNYEVAWNAVTGGENYVLQEAVGEGGFTQIYAGPDTSQFISGRGKGVYHYRVQAYNAEGRPSRWSNIETVTVTQAAALGTTPASLPMADGTSMAGSAASGIAASAMPSVTVSTDGGATWGDATVTWNADGWWDWTYDWTLPEADGAAYVVRARAMYPGGGGYNEDAITVTLQNSTKFLYLPLMMKQWPPYPHAPTLSVGEPNSDGDYTVSWSYGYTDIPITCGYELQEDTDPSFSDPTLYFTSLEERTFTGKTDDTYYYRVRGCHAWSGQSLWGPWSAVKSVEVSFSLIYEFTHAGDTQGWAIRRSDEGESEQLPPPVFKDGKLYHLIQGKADFSIISPLEPAPQPPYVIEASVDIVNREVIDDGYDDVEYVAKQGMTYGIIFGANGDGTCPTKKGSVQGCLYHYYRLLVAYDAGQASLKWQFKRIEHHDEKAEGRGETLRDWSYLEGHFDDALGWNTWRIEVSDVGDPHNIKVYLNGNFVGGVEDYTYVDDLYFGVFQASPEELGAVATKWDWFHVTK
jgi:uncharacterized repeat protein (TIGR01451 family)